jgi:hypothetical protein
MTTTWKLTVTPAGDVRIKFKEGSTQEEQTKAQKLFSGVALRVVEDDMTYTLRGKIKSLDAESITLYNNNTTQHFCYNL